MTTTDRTNFVRDSRGARPLVTARLVRLEGGGLALHAPAVGLWRDRPPMGSLVRPGSLLGRITLLGEDLALVAPEGARGIVVSAVGDELAQHPVAYDDRLLVLDRAVAAGQAEEESAAAGQEASTGLTVRAPSSGRFYRRPGPGKPEFVAVGDVIDTGKVVGLLEVMKTFTRIQYGGGELPARARVVALYAEDEADVSAGDPLIVVEPA